MRNYAQVDWGEKVEWVDITRFPDIPNGAGPAALCSGGLKCSTRCSPLCSPFLSLQHIQKLQLVLTPFQSLFPLSLDEGPPDRTTLLTHSFRQLDRIESLSEQIGFLEERLGTCKWSSDQI